LLGGLPIRVVELRLLPAPGVCGRVHAIPGSRDVVPVVDLGGHDGQGRVGLVADRLPGLIGADRLLGLAGALQEEARLLRDLGLRGVDAEVPDDGREHVAAGAQMRREVHRLVAPVVQVAARRAPDDALAIREELVAVVGGDADGEAAGTLAELERAPEVVDAVIEGRRARHRDPARGPGGSDLHAVGGGGQEREDHGGGGEEAHARYASRFWRVDRRAPLAGAAS